MEDQLSLDEMIGRYLTDANRAAASLFEQGLYGFYLVVVYSSIDTLGLLGAPPGQTEATSDSFKDWVRSYLVPQAKDPFTADDLWGARCGVLHTFTTESRISRQGKARQLQYYLAENGAARQFVEVTGRIESGAHLAVHLGHLGTSFYSACAVFGPHLAQLCATSEKHAQRVRNVLQIYPI